MSRLVVVGAGISGLAAAHAARWDSERLDLPLEIIVLERDAEAGGKARSLREDGYLIEAGLSVISVIDRKVSLESLILDLAEHRDDATPVEVAR